MDQDLTQIEILLVEDNPQDVEITMRALQKKQVKNRVVVARDGQEALDIPCAGSSREHHGRARPDRRLSR